MLFLDYTCNEYQFRLTKANNVLLKRIVTIFINIDMNLCLDRYLPSLTNTVVIDLAVMNYVQVFPPRSWAQDTHHIPPLSALFTQLL